MLWLHNNVLTVSDEVSTSLTVLRNVSLRTFGYELKLLESGALGRSARLWKWLCWSRRMSESRNAAGGFSADGRQEATWQKKSHDMKKTTFLHLVLGAVVLAAALVPTSARAAAGDLYVPDGRSGTIFKFTPAGTQSTFAS